MVLSYLTVCRLIVAAKSDDISKRDSHQTERVWNEWVADPWAGLYTIQQVCQKESDEQAIFSPDNKEANCLKQFLLPDDFQSTSSMDTSNPVQSFTWSDVESDRDTPAPFLHESDFDELG